MKNEIGSSRTTYFKQIMPPDKLNIVDREQFQATKFQDQDDFHPKLSSGNKSSTSPTDPHSPHSPNPSRMELPTHFHSGSDLVTRKISRKYIKKIFQFKIKNQILIVLNLCAEKLVDFLYRRDFPYHGYERIYKLSLLFCWLAFFLILFPHEKLAYYGTLLNKMGLRVEELYHCLQLKRPLIKRHPDIIVELHPRA